MNKLVSQIMESGTQLLRRVFDNQLLLFYAGAEVEISHEGLTSEQFEESIPERLQVVITNPDGLKQAISVGSIVRVGISAAEARVFIVETAEKDVQRQLGGPSSRVGLPLTLRLEKNSS